MPCKFCLKEPVINLVNNNIKLCKVCFIRYFEKKVFKTIRIYDLLDDCKKIGIAVSGKNSMIVAHILNKIIQQRISKNIELIAIYIKEDTKNTKLIKEFCKKENIKLYIYPIKKSQDFSILIRLLLNKKSRDLKIERLATGHNIDSEVQTVLMNQLKNNIERSSRLGVIVNADDKRLVPRIKPLYFILESETELYAKLNNIKYIKNKNKDSLRENVKELLNEMESKYPGTKSNLLNSFIEILPSLKKKYKTKIKDCVICGNPSSSNICNVCKLTKS
ncbi:MAG: TIGR00269 family protein [Nanoarchaeota archaeon]|nr:TIGR00269 family protein [Nanoarchaeota archaeon]MBU0963240.1 TIGR00269 family protein [Nanoarchaeota archaeon]